VLHNSQHTQNQYTKVAALPGVTQQSAHKATQS
jgi:hypothetical protein